MKLCTLVILKFESWLPSAESTEAAFGTRIVLILEVRRLRPRMDRAGSAEDAHREVARIAAPGLP